MAIKSIHQLSEDTVSVIFENPYQLIDGTHHQELLLNILESSVNRVTDVLLLNVRDYTSTGRSYSQGEGCFYLGVLYRCTVLSTSGTFNPLHWSAVTSGLQFSDVIIPHSNGQTHFTLSTSPNVYTKGILTISGCPQKDSDFSVTGNVLTYSGLPLVDTDDVVIYKY